MHALSGMDGKHGYPKTKSFSFHCPSMVVMCAICRNKTKLQVPAAGAVVKLIVEIALIPVSPACNGSGPIKSPAFMVAEGTVKFPPTLAATPDDFV